MGAARADADGSSLPVPRAYRPAPVGRRAEARTAAARAAAAVGGAGGGAAVETGGRVALETGQATVDVADVARERGHVYTIVRCSDLLHEVHRSHRCKMDRNHRNGVPGHPLS
jgi:hypothetical protein